VTTRFVPGTIDYNGAMASHYPEGRALSAHSAETWRAVIRSFLPAIREPRFLDLGSGTGRFSRFLAESFGGKVIGVEPARGMRRMAARSAKPESVVFVGGAAEAIPLADQSCDVAWLSQVLHHFTDQAASARELYRVVRASGRVLIRGTFAEGADGFPTFLRHFPGIIRIFGDLPTIEGTIARFEAQGFELMARQRIAQQTCGSLREFAERTRLRADSSLALLCDTEFNACQAELENAAAQETEPAPVVETLDFLAFRRNSDVPVR
jgi:ubiquinone/menaquinone biosynthesis C-methylase UbiE